MNIVISVRTSQLHLLILLVNPPSVQSLYFMIHQAIQETNLSEDDKLQLLTYAWKAPATYKFPVNSEWRFKSFLAGYV